MAWSKDILEEWDIISVPSLPDEAIIDVKFKCGRTLLAEGVEVPQPFYGGDTSDKSRRWGESVYVECKCGEPYDVVADNSIVGRDVNFEGGKAPKTFKVRIVEEPT